MVFIYHESTDVTQTCVIQASLNVKYHENKRQTYQIYRYFQIHLNILKILLFTYTIPDKHFLYWSQIFGPTVHVYCIMILTVDLRISFMSVKFWVFICCWFLVFSAALYF